ncbi:MAG: hypothetical protein QM582_06815 [Micropruina sp.]|uniref:hypothetical protein n=1 Tax=Micropruina sp. TaxID=2737536 RepID=UPI0039E69A31
MSQAALDISLDMRFFAAVVVYGQAAVATIATLKVIRLAADRGLVELSAAARTGPIVVSQPMAKPMSSFRLT